MLWKSMTALGSTQSPDASNVSFLGCGSKVNKMVPHPLGLKCKPPSSNPFAETDRGGGEGKSGC